MQHTTGFGRMLFEDLVSVLAGVSSMYRKRQIQFVRQLYLFDKPNLLVVVLFFLFEPMVIEADFAYSDNLFIFSKVLNLF